MSGSFSRSDMLAMRNSMARMNNTPTASNYVDPEALRTCPVQCVVARAAPKQGSNPSHRNYASITVADLITMCAQDVQANSEKAALAQLRVALQNGFDEGRIDVAMQVRAHFKHCGKELDLESHSIVLRTALKCQDVKLAAATMSDLDRLKLTTEVLQKDPTLVSEILSLVVSHKAQNLNDAEPYDNASRAVNLLAVPSPMRPTPVANLLASPAKSSVASHMNSSPGGNHHIMHTPMKTRLTPVSSSASTLESSGVEDALNLLTAKSSDVLSAAVLAHSVMTPARHHAQSPSAAGLMMTMSTPNHATNAANSSAANSASPSCSKNDLIVRSEIDRLLSICHSDPTKPLPESVTKRPTEQTDAPTLSLSVPEVATKDKSPTAASSSSLNANSKPFAPSISLSAAAPAFTPVGVNSQLSVAAPAFTPAPETVKRLSQLPLSAAQRLQVPLDPTEAAKQAAALLQPSLASPAPALVNPVATAKAVTAMAVVNALSPQRALEVKAALSASAALSPAHDGPSPMPVTASIHSPMPTARLAAQSPIFDAAGFASPARSKTAGATSSAAIAAFNLLANSPMARAHIANPSPSITISSVGAHSSVAPTPSRQPTQDVMASPSPSPSASQVIRDDINTPKPRATAAAKKEKVKKEATAAPKAPVLRQPAVAKTQTLSSTTSGASDAHDAEDDGEMDLKTALKQMKHPKGKAGFIYKPVAINKMSVSALDEDATAESLVDSPVGIEQSNNNTDSPVAPPKKTRRASLAQEAAAAAASNAHVAASQKFFLKLQQSMDQDDPWAEVPAAPKQQQQQQPLKAAASSSTTASSKKSHKESNGNKKKTDTLDLPPGLNGFKAVHGRKLGNVSSSASTMAASNFTASPARHRAPAAEAVCQK